MVTLLRRGLAAIGIVVLASLVAAGPANAQGAQPVVAPNPDVGFIGIPDYTSAETGIPFFFKDHADAVDTAIKDMRNAGSKCDRKAYDVARTLLNRRIARNERNNTYARGGEFGTLSAEGRLNLAKAQRDAETFKEAANRLPAFPENCNPPSTGSNNYGPFEVFVIGGGMVPLNGSGAVTGVDTFFGAGNFLISNSPNNASSSAVPMVGVRARANVLNLGNSGLFLDAGFLGDVIRGKNTSSPPSSTPRGPGVSVFIESGIQSSFGAQSSLQTFQKISATPQGFGSNTVKENFQIPILAGVGVPISGSGSTPVFLDLYGGITISNSTQTLQGGEVGAPTGRGFFAESKRTTVDPTIGTGVRAVIADFSGGALPPLIIGANAEFSFRPGNVVQAQSPNFPSQSYYGTVDPRANATFTVRVGFPFGGTR